MGRKGAIVAAIVVAAATAVWLLLPAGREVRPGPARPTADVPGTKPPPAAGSTSRPAPVGATKAGADASGAAGAGARDAAGGAGAKDAGLPASSAPRAGAKPLPD